MNPTLWSLAGGALHILIVLVAFFVVPVNRKPSSATAWLLLITIAPLIGVVIFLLIGSPKLTPRRRQLQHQMSGLIAQAIEQASGDRATASLLKPAVPAVALPHTALAQKLGGMPAFAGNGVELLPTYNAIIERMAQEIEGAQRYAHIEFYIIARDTTTEVFFAAMERAVKRGVKVRLLLDQIGSRKYPGRKEMEQHLTAIGVAWHYMLPVGKPGEWLRFDLRNHRKILVVDGEAGYTGSLNVIDRTYHRKDELYYDELCVRVVGPVVIQLEAAFVTDWYAETGELLDPRNYPELQRTGWHAQGTALCQVLPSGPGFDDENNLRLFTGLINAAQRRLVIVNPYFVPDDALMLAVTSAALRGVKVTLINSEAVDQLFVASAQKSYYEQLLRAGVEVLQYKLPILLHSKTIAVDDQIAMIGSSNLDIRSFTLNLEVSLVVYDTAVVAELSKIFDTYIARSKRVELQTWKSRPATQRLIENVARLTAALQ
ncbi:cardiolipin synthase [Candidatus Chloroploca asiatica]|uniref:Cardiolipin synthase n=1 Tax=Candidatus Chloroploca asiatica TaxID=1506545 RepID=A0A2H3KKT5_9CHLR|nr:cardiolipin synthase [Candidatus Chloroploca asiatica]PDV97851.1 cardiolipin synthase [Candidatus Chloroploca asiatica]